MTQIYTVVNYWWYPCHEGWTISKWAHGTERHFIWQHKFGKADDSLFFGNEQIRLNKTKQENYRKS